MHIRRIITFLTPQPRILIPVRLPHSKAHTKICPVSRPRKVCPGAGKAKDKFASIKRGPVCPKIISSSGGSDDKGGIKRALTPGKCRMGFIPEEWFLFFRPFTGVSGPYILMIGLGNYLLSKEIYVMEHEFYLGISVAIMVYYTSTRFGPIIGAALDKEVDAIANEFEQGRNDELAANKKQIKDAEIAIWRAEGQKDLIDAKKENVAMQLEAIYRERLMMVYKNVQSRMNYHVKRHMVDTRVKHKWMVQWILENVNKSITPEFKRQAMETAIKELTVLANRPQK